jgi:uncharacterized protein
VSVPLPTQPGPAAEAHPPARARPVGRRVLAFAALAYALSWAWELPLLLGGGTVVPGTGWPTHVPALAGPAIAALIVASATGGLHRIGRALVRVRVAPRWWVVALSPIIMFAVAMGWVLVAGDALPSGASFAVFSGLPSAWGVIGVTAVVLLVNGFGEETGWRGFLLPALQARFSPLVAMGLLTLIWAGWHAPMFGLVSTFAGFGVATLAGWLLGLAAGSVVLGWLYNRTGSIVLVAVWHTAYNMVGATAGSPGVVVAIITTVVMVHAVVLVGLELRARRRGLPSVLGPTRRSDPAGSSARRAR